MQGVIFLILKGTKLSEPRTPYDMTCLRVSIPCIPYNFLFLLSTYSFLKPTTHSRVLSLQYAMVGFSSCHILQIFLIDRKNVSTMKCPSSSHGSDISG